MKLKLSIFPLLAVLLMGCASLGVPPADTFNKKAAVAEASIQAAGSLTLSLLQAHKITPSDGQNAVDQKNAFLKGVDVAKELSATDLSAADAKLKATQLSLEILKRYLEERQ